jgi:hypothetical protein
MKAMKIVAVATAMMFAAPADAHRLDELLQAVQVHLFANHVELEVTLTPGVNLAGAFFAGADRDGNGSVSPAEAETFAARWLEKVTLTIDGTAVQPRIASATFPPLQDLSGGEGIVRISVRSPDAALRGGHHQLSIRNDNEPDASIYLENAVIPIDKRIVIATQRRNTTQSMYTVDYDVASPLSWLSPSWLFVATGAVLLLLLQNRLRGSAESST